MSDLKTRIGPKVGQELFHHKTWVRPGYEVKPTKQRTQWHHRRQSEEYGSDVSEHESDSPRRTPKSNRPASLLTRMGLESPDREEEGRRNMTPSLLERVGEIEPDNRQIDGISDNDSISDLGETQWTPPKASYAGESIRSRAQGLHVDLKAGPANNGANLLNQPVTTEDKKTFLDSNTRHLTSQSSGNGSVVKDRRNTTQYGHIATHSTERISDKGPSIPHSTNGLPNPNPVSAVPSHLQPNATSTSSASFQKTLSQHTVSEDGELPNRDMPSKDTPSLEEGEVLSRSLSADKVRALVLPLVLRNAANRVTDAEQATVSSQSPPPVNAAALTDELLTSFAAKGTTEVRRAMRAREGGSSNSAWGPQRPSSSRHDISNVLLATPMAGPSLMTSGKETGHSTVRSTTNVVGASHASMYDRDREHGPPLRRHPSPQTNEFAPTPSMNQVNEPSASKLSETCLEPRVKRLRSRSPPPQHYPRRRRSSSREEGPSTYERPSHQSEYGSRSTHGHGYSRSTYERPHHVSGPHRPHTPPPVSRPQFAERMMGRSPSPMSRSAGRETRSPIRGKEIHSPPPASPTRYARRPHTEREEGHRRKYSAHYGSLEYPDTRHRKPYEQRSTERRRSRTPPRRLSVSDQHTTLSLRRRSQDRMDVDYDYGYRSKTPSIEGHRDYVPLSPQRPQREESWQRIPIQESPISKALAAQPQANAPLWSANRGLGHLGILKWTFEVDQQAATRLGLDKKLENHASSTDTASQKPTKKTSLRLACYPKDQVIKLIERVHAGKSPTPESSSIDHIWPMFGHLIIRVNEELLGFQGKTWLPDKLGPNSPTIILDRFIRQGQNVIELVQLSGMDDKVFWLSEQDNPDTNDQLLGITHEFTLANSEKLFKLFPITAIVTISDVDELT